LTTVPPETETYPQPTEGRGWIVGTVTPRPIIESLPGTYEKVQIVKPLHERLALPGAALAGIGFAVFLGPILGFVGNGWLPLTGFIWMLLTYVVLTRLDDSGPAVKDKFASVLLSSAALVVSSLLLLVIGFVGYKSWEFVRTGSLHLSFLTQDMGLTGPLSKLDEGGIKHAMVGTIEQIGIALILTVPLGIATALFLNEIGGRYARLIRTIVEAMTALPSVVAGLFILASVILLITKQFNGFAASLAITVLMLPIMIRSSDVVLRLVPGNLREAGLALGAGQWSVVRRVVLPTIKSGLMTAMILATAHGIGETAPVLLTSGFTNNTNFDPFNNPQNSLPLAALEFVKSGVPNLVTRGYATAGVLLILVLILFTVARLAGGQQAGQLSNRQLRARVAQSQRDLPRIEENHARVKARLSQQRLSSSSTVPPAPGAFS
jgi:phosphate transport system permease protein